MIRKDSDKFICEMCGGPAALDRLCTACRTKSKTTPKALEKAFDTAEPKVKSVHI